MLFVVALNQGVNFLIISFELILVGFNINLRGEAIKFLYRPFFVEAIFNHSFFKNYNTTINPTRKFKIKYLHH